MKMKSINMRQMTIQKSKIDLEVMKINKKHSKINCARCQKKMIPNQEKKFIRNLIMVNIKYKNCQVPLEWMNHLEMKPLNYIEV